MRLQPWCQAKVIEIRKITISFPQRYLQKQFVSTEAISPTDKAKLETILNTIENTEAYLAHVRSLVDVLMKRRTE